ncbi:MAG TPA: protein-disulfide reductase DsbD family protein [Quisquiliibacterium sp.]|nr:protein-disulfide reductase DsbD family protein [Quisquiliibacterium sp.]
MKKFASLALVLILLAVTLAVRAQPVRVDAVEVELVADRTAAQPGQPLMLGLRIRHDPKWHTYWRNPGDSGLPTTLALSLPDGWTSGGFVWPAPTRVFVGPLANYAYEGEVLLPVPVTVPASAPSGTVRLSGTAQWLMCRDVCIPGEARLTLALPVGGEARPSTDAPLFAAARSAAPAQHLAVDAGLADGRMSLTFELPQAAAAEFFPYGEGLISAPASQRLHRVDGNGRWRLDLRAAADATPEAFEKAGFHGASAGVLVVDGRPYEVAARRVAAAGEGGTFVSATLEAAAAAAPSGGSGGRLLQAGGGLAGGGLAGGPAGGVSAEAGGTPGAAGSLLLAVAFAVVGGLILNLMPCVFPVIGLKVLGFARHGGDGRRQGGGRGAAAFAAGVLVSFWALAALLVVLRQAGQAAGWGFQLQSPVFVSLMALLFVLIGLNLAGVFEIGLALTRLGNRDPLASSGGRDDGGLLASFGSGVLAVLVATPCTAPFMGSALGYTLGRPAAEVLLVFTGVAVGMAAPYVLLGCVPAALRWLPRPGRWMESFRQFLAFPMFATVAWLAWVLGQQAGVDAVLALCLGAVLVALAAWLYGRFVQSGGRRRGLALVAALVSCGAGGWLVVDAAATAAAPATATAVSPAVSATGGSAEGAASGTVAVPGGWAAWSERAVADAVAAGRPVFVDFTAAWCVSCQVNKKLVLERASIAAQFERQGVVRLRADWTNRDAAIGAALARHGRNGVPLYLLYRPGEAAPRVLPEILTAGIVEQALEGLR